MEGPGKGGALVLRPSGLGRNPTAALLGLPGGLQNTGLLSLCGLVSQPLLVHVSVHPYTPTGPQLVQSHCPWDHPLASASPWDPTPRGPVVVARSPWEGPASPRLSPRSSQEAREPCRCPSQVGLLVCGWCAWFWPCSLACYALKTLPFSQRSSPWALHVLLPPLTMLFPLHLTGQLHTFLERLHGAPWRDRTRSRGERDPCISRHSDMALSGTHEPLRGGSPERQTWPEAKPLVACW